MFRAAIISDRECLAEEFEDYRAGLDWGRAKLRCMAGCDDSASLHISRNGEVIVNVLPSDIANLTNYGQNQFIYDVRRDIGAERV